MSDERLEPAEVELQQWVDGLLTAEEAVPVAPESLRWEVRRELNRKRWNTWVWRGVAAAAALGTVLLWPSDAPVSGDRQLVQTPTPATTTQTASPSAPVATFVGRGDLIVVPLESSDPTVTIVQVYPSTITQRRWQREAALRAALTNSQPTPETPVRGG